MIHKICKFPNYKIKILFMLPFCFVIGIFAIGTTPISVSRQIQFSDAISTTAVITSVSYNSSSETHTVKIVYFVNDVEYESKLNYYSSNMKVNDKVNIKYLPDNPSRIIDDGNTTLIIIGIISSIVSLILLIIVLRLIIITYLNNKHLNSLVTKGVRKTLIIQSFEYQYNITINRRHPFYIICFDEFNNITYQSNSTHLHESKYNIGDKINLYVDKNDKDIFYLDTKNTFN